MYANGTKDWFKYLATSARNCDVACMNNCSCIAYAYNRSGCMISEGALFNLHQLSHGD
jgi:hypothetical protein